MIIKWKSEYIGHIGFEATPDDYDGIPKFANYWLDAGPKLRHPDREAVAAFLIYGSYLGGLTQMPHKFSPAVDVVLRDAAGEASAAFSPIEYYPKALPVGSRTMRLSWSEDEKEKIDAEGVADVFLRLERSDRVSGSMRSVNGLTVASNAWIHVPDCAESIYRIYPFLAAAVLYAEDLEADTIQVQGNYDKDKDAWETIVRLLGSARLGIKCVK